MVKWWRALTRELKNRDMKKLFKNWKTTLAGLLFILPKIVPALKPFDEAIEAVSVGLLGTAAADGQDEEKK